MSRSLVALALSTLLVPAGVAAQDAAAEYQPLPDPATEAADPECEQGEDGEIVVCGFVDETENYMSPIPRETASDRIIIPGLTDPPCWVTGGGPPSCVRFGWVPPPALIIDVTAFPEPLSAADAADVYAVAPEENPDTQASDRPAVGERVPIDLSENPGG